MAEIEYWVSAKSLSVEILLDQLIEMGLFFCTIIVSLAAGYLVRRDAIENYSCSLMSFYLRSILCSVFSIH